MRIGSWRSLALTVALSTYVALGIYTQVSYAFEKPLPQYLMEDYGYYARAFERWREGGDPYADRVIGSAFIYPPQALLLVAGFEALGPLPIKFATYATLSFLSLAGIVYLVMRACRLHPGDPRRAMAVVLALAYAPAIWSIYLGQVNVLLALAVAAGFFLADRRPALAGSAIAIGAAIKLTPGLLLLLFLQRRYLRVHAGFAVTSLVLLLAAGLAFGFHQYATYVGVARELGAATPLGQGRILTLINALYLLSGAVGLPMSGWQHTVQLVYACGMLALVAAGVWLTRDGKDRHLVFAMIALAMTTMPNVVWYHHLVFPLAALLTLLFSPESSTFLRAGTCIVLALIQLDRVLQPKLNVLLTTPSCVLLAAAVLATLVVRARAGWPSLAPERARAQPA